MTSTINSFLTEYNNHLYNCIQQNSTQEETDEVFSLITQKILTDDFLLPIEQRASNTFRRLCTVLTKNLRKASISDATMKDKVLKKLGYIKKSSFRAPLKINMTAITNPKEYRKLTREVSFTAPFIRRNPSMESKHIDTVKTPAVTAILGLDFDGKIRHGS